ncbi:MAG: helix-turn-helix domain-containing protein [Bryobacteraceae bacterium]
MRTRTGEGRARAKLRGQRMGRPPKMTAAQKQEARRRRKDGGSVADLARSYGVSPAAIYRTTFEVAGLMALDLRAFAPTYAIGEPLGSFRAWNSLKSSIVTF